MRTPPPRLPPDRPIHSDAQVGALHPQEIRMNQNGSARSNAFSIPLDEIADWMSQPVPRAKRPVAPVIKIAERRTPPLHGKNWKVPMGPNSRR